MVGPDGVLLVRFGRYYDAVPRLLPFLPDNADVGDLLAGLEAAGLRHTTIEPAAWLEEQPELELPANCTTATLALFEPLPPAARCLCGYLEVRAWRRARVGVRQVLGWVGAVGALGARQNGQLRCSEQCRNLSTAAPGEAIGHGRGLSKHQSITQAGSRHCQNAYLPSVAFPPTLVPMPLLAAAAAACMLFLHVHGVAPRCC